MIEEETEDKVLKKANGRFTTVLGWIIMSSQVIEYFYELYGKGVVWELVDYGQAALIMGGGYALLYMKEDIAGWIRERFKKG